MPQDRPAPAGAFYIRTGPDTYDSTPATAGPWSAESQHGGPPSALLAAAIEHAEGGEGQRLGRLTVEILRPVPVAPLTVRARVVRPGRRVSLVEAVAESGGRECLLARGWRLAAGPAPEVRVDWPPPAPLPESASSRPAWPGAHLDGYMSAIEARFTAGAMDRLGPADAWMRARLPLVEGEPTSPFCAAVVVSDSGSGLSIAHDPAHALAINVELTVSAWREPAAGWVHMSSRTVLGGSGAGLADTLLGDAGGWFGRAGQVLYAEASGS